MDKKKTLENIWEYYDYREKQKKRICLYLSVNILFGSIWLPILFISSHKDICVGLVCFLLGNIIGMLYMLIGYDKKTESNVIDKVIPYK